MSKLKQILDNSAFNPYSLWICSYICICLTVKNKKLWGLYTGNSISEERLPRFKRETVWPNIGRSQRQSTW